jgi:abnormal spindle-like microcephaly-associated protein
VKDSKVKSSRDVLVAVCRDFLSQEGDITKHLARIGLKVYYSQEPIDEIDYSIDNLAIDIRDGVRLARMTEIPFE